MKIVTKYKTNHNGRSQILAKGGGKQRTISFEDAHSFPRNHGNAAGTLALALNLDWHDGITHEVTDNGQHVFKF